MNTTPRSSDAIRETFEARIKDLAGSTTRPILRPDSNHPERYQDWRVQENWETWQAAMASLPRMRREELDELILETYRQHSSMQYSSEMRVEAITEALIATGCVNVKDEQ